MRGWPQIIWAVVTCWILQVPPGGYGQISREKSHHIWAATGVSNNFIRDRQASPLTYRGLSPSVSIGYEYQGSKIHHSFEIRSHHAELQSSTAHKASFKELYLHYQISRRMTRLFRDQMSIFLGGGLDFTSSDRIFRYFGEHFFEPYQNHFMSFLVNVSLWYSLSPGTHFQFNLSLPMWTYMVHSGYSYSAPKKLVGKNDYSDWDYIRSGTLSNWNRFQGFQMGLFIDKGISRSLGMVFSWQLRFFQYPFPRQLRFATNQILLGLQVGF